MARLFLLTGLLICTFQPALASDGSVSAADVRSAWLAFNSARGTPSLIQGDRNHPSANAVFRVIPDASAGNLDEDRLQLGFELFNEKRLSRDGSVACSTCHIGLLGGVDRQPVSFGIDGARGTLNAPTIFNAALNFRQFWDGRSLTLQDQALEPIQNPAEFGHDLDGAVAVLNSIPEYVQSFASLYPDGITVANLADAIAYYETMNFTGVSSPFLRQFEEGDGVMSRRARRGQQRFVELGCASCHNGVNLGGNSYQKLGVTVDWYGDDRPASTADDGLYARTGRDEDRHVFKVPTLHNVANTGPWFHDGSVASLQQAVDQMARHQSGRYLDNNDIDDIVAFLRTTGDSQGMLGDCAVGGNYGVTLECSVKQRTAANDSQLPEVTAPLPEADALLVRHAEAYQEALQRVAMAPARIESEMQRIRSGEVAHYDFLQFEHIEMLRHARALSHPVANVNGSERESLLSEARRLQAEASRYEIIIADFLRGHAAALNARLNYQDLLRHFSLGADEKTTLLLGEAEDSLLRYYAVPDSESQSRLEAATSALHELEFDEQKLLELARQVRVLTASRTSERSAQGD